MGFVARLFCPERMRRIGGGDVSPQRQKSLAPKKTSYKFRASKKGSFNTAKRLPEFRRNVGHEMGKDLWIKLL
jgi:hypothetical protein